MTQKKLNSYLSKAEYIRPAIRGFKATPISPIRTITQRKNKARYILSHLQRTPYKTLSPANIEKALKSSNISVLSLHTTNLESATKDVKVAKTVYEVEKKKDLHLLYYTMLYFALKKRSSISWKRPYRYNAALRLKNMNIRPPLVGKSPISNSKICKITSKEQDLLLAGKEILEQNQVAMEQEYSDRRNYRNSTSLHT